MTNLRKSGVFSLGGLSGDGEGIPAFPAGSDFKISNGTVTGATYNGSGPTGSGYSSYWDTSSGSNYFSFTPSNASSPQAFTVIVDFETTNTNAFKVLAAFDISNPSQRATFAADNAGNIIWYDGSSQSFGLPYSANTRYVAVAVYDGSAITGYLVDTAAGTTITSADMTSAKGTPTVSPAYTTSWNSTSTLGRSALGSAEYLSGQIYGGGYWSGKLTEAQLADAINNIRGNAAAALTRPTRRWGGMLGRSLTTDVDKAPVVDHSLRFDGSSDRLSFTPSSTTDNQTFTLSAWVRRSSTGSAQYIFGAYDNGNNTNSGYLGIFFNTSDNIRIGGWSATWLNTTTTYTDTSKWLHIVASVSATYQQVKLWVNGSEPAHTETVPLTSQTFPVNTAGVAMTLGRVDYNGGSWHLNGQLAEVHFVDGQALTAADFGETNASGQWVPREVAGGFSYGNNGFYLPLSTPSSETNAFNAVTWSGDGASTRTLDAGLEPDLVWVRTRNIGHYPRLFDSVRGFSNVLIPSETFSQNTYVDYGEVTATSSTGFTVGPDSGGSLINTVNSNYVAWTWKAGGAPTSNGTAMVNGVATTTSSIATAASASITPTKMSVSTEAGFSIVQYTGTGSAATIPHGLNSAPDFVWCKTMDSANQWHCGHTALGWNSHIHLDLPNGATSTSTAWDTTAPDGSVVSLGTSGGSNKTNESMIMYCWHSVPGYSKIGSYSGSGGAGNKVTTGFKPAFVMIKSTASNNWVMIDNKRSPVNYADEILYADDYVVEGQGGATTSINFLADGFDFGGGGGGINSSGSHSYIYMAFADTSPNLGLDATTDGTGVTLLLDGSSANDATGLSTVTPSASGYSVNQTSGAKFNNSQYIDMTGGYFNVTLPSAIGVNNEPFTVETWAWLDSSGGPDGVFQLLQGSATITSNSNILPANSLAMGVYNGSWRAYDEAGVHDGLQTVVNSDWHHVALTYDGSTLRWFLNGAVLLTRAVSAISGGLPAAGYRNLGVGVFYNSGEAMDGRLEGFRITQGIARDIASGFSGGTPITGGGWDVALTNDDTWDKPQNNLAVNGNITPDDQLLDSPNLRFATMDPDNLYHYSGTGTLAEANLKFEAASVSYQGSAMSTIGKTSGKWYCEILAEGTDPGIGLYDGDFTATDLSYENYANQPNQRIAVNGPGRLFALGTQNRYRWTYPASPTGTEYDANSACSPSTYSGHYNWTSGTTVVGMAIDLDAGKLEVFFDGVSQNVPFDDLGDASYSTGNAWHVAVCDWKTSETNKSVFTLNFGQDHTFAGTLAPLSSPETDDDGNGEFYYQPPSGFKALATKIVGSDTLLQSTGVISLAEHYQTKLPQP